MPRAICAMSLPHPTHQNSLSVCPFFAFCEPLPSGKLHPGELPFFRAEPFFFQTAKCRVLYDVCTFIRIKHRIVFLYKHYYCLRLMRRCPCSTRRRRSRDILGCFPTFYSNRLDLCQMQLIIRERKFNKNCKTTSLTLWMSFGLCVCVCVCMRKSFFFYDLYKD